MARKRPSLFKEPPLPAAPPPQPPEESKEVTEAVRPAKIPPSVRRRGTEAPGRPPSRQGKRVLSVYVEPEAAMQLGILAIREGSSVQALMVEAVNDFFAKRGMNRIA